METVIRENEVGKLIPSNNFFQWFNFAQHNRPFFSDDFEFNAFNDEDYQTIVKSSEIKASISKDIEYLDFIRLNSQYQTFDALLSEFLTIYDKESDYTPYFFELVVFKFPEENYFDPMLKIVYQDTEKFSVVKLRDKFLNNLREFLAQRSQGIEEFKALRKIENKYRFIVRRG